MKKRGNMKYKQFAAVLICFIFITALFSGCSSHERTVDSDAKSTTEASALSGSISDESTVASTPKPTTESSELSVSTSEGPTAAPVTESLPSKSGIIDYRYEMRQFVQELSAYMKTASPGFAVIPQNGENIVIEDGVVFKEYMDAIDGIGREDFLYGYYDDDETTPVEDRDYMLPWINLYPKYGKSVLVIDYCSAPEKVQDSYSTNASYGFISFTADERELFSIPALPQPIYNENADNIQRLSDAKNFLYIINPEAYSSKSDFLSAVAGTNYDLVIVDLFWDDSPLTAEDVSRIKVKSNGAGRMVVCYMSIGEAEDYRYYWENDWYSDPPAWLGGENPDWEGNYKVNYWDPQWQQIIYGNDSSYAKKVLNAGFDGVYLDLIDAFEYYEKE